ncbi:hypothetical protein BDR26DRAFT_919477 [Obelidium mucronatum]|nr:hypothetical protein BDR26DRAFT_919477 [Obelidium mucronatum]
MPQQSTDPVTIVVSLVILFFVFRYLLASQTNESPNGSRQAGTAAGSQAAAAGTGRRPRRQVAVSQAKVDAVLNMFPNYSRDVIEQDLARSGGNVEQTIENILSGVLPPPPPPPVEPSSNASSSSSSPSTPSAFTPSPYLTPKVLDPSTPTTEPPKVWEQTSAGREANLRARKEHMVRLARERMEKAAAAAATTSAGGVGNGESGNSTAAATQ